MKKLIEKYFDRLWPINRSLTGNGNRETLKILSEIIDLNIIEIPSGTQCFDWTVPPEWNAKEAWINDENGNKIVDFKKNNLHLLGYSQSYKGKLNLSELKEHLYSLPDQPDAIPYLTSYYSKRWGFCLTHRQLLSLKEGIYEVMIDSEFDDNGSMTIGEAIIKGESEDEILLSTNICHPSLANNELSGPLVAAFICSELKKIKKRKYTYRFVFLPETIGSICYLAMQGQNFKSKLKAGYVITCIGDSGSYTYKRSRRGDALADRAAELVLRQTEKDFIVTDFFPMGSDERQYCSPGFNLPVGSLMKTQYYKFSEYHTSKDNKDFISFQSMEDAVMKYLQIFFVIENNFTYSGTMQNCEPQLGKRDLYPTLGSKKDTSDFINSIMWVLNLSDGKNDLIKISDRSGINFKSIKEAAEKLAEKNLLTEVKAV